MRLYKKYSDEIDSNKKLFNLLDIKYEDLIMDSNKVLNEIFDYLEMNISYDEYQNIERILDKSRVYAFKNNKLDFDDKLLELIDY